jgi:3',5'-cyclic AMP phosphodiesterase CpdA
MAGMTSHAMQTNPPPTRHGTQAIRFVVVNDFHHQGPECDPWMEALFKQIAGTEDAAFCLGLGDFAHEGKRESMEVIQRLSAAAGMPFHPVPGNHDLDESPVDGFYAEVFPGCRNYLVRHKGWQFVLIDSTDGNKWQDVTISESTLDWLERTLADLDPDAPTVLCTHFPLASEVPMCPLNAGAVLVRFRGHNLRGVLGGHFHGRTSTPHGDIRLVTNACASRVCDNHDDTPEKGYLVVDGTSDGRLSWRFVEFKGV